MMATLEEAIRALEGEMDGPMLETYIAHAWVRPIDAPTGRRLEDIDIARARLIRHLQRDLAVGDDAMDVLLSLLDQLYDMHDRMRLLEQALGAQPPEHRLAIAAAIRKAMEP